MAQKLTKKEKLLKAQQDNLKLLISTIAATLIFLYFFVSSLCQYIGGGLTYSQAKEMHYTFDSFSNQDGKNYIYVEQEKNPLLITSITMDRDLYDALKELESGTDIHCYVIKTRALGFDYEIVELEADSLLLSLDDYNQSHKSNDLGGVIFCAVFALLSSAVTCLFAFSYKIYKDKLKKKISRNTSETRPS